MSFRRSRAMTLAVVIWSGLALALVLYNTIRTFSASCGSSDEELFGDIFSGNAVCVNIAAHGGKAELVFSLAIQVGIIWAVGIGILAAIWFIVRDRGPASASVTVASVPAFPAAAPVAAPSAPPEGWYADAERPGHTRWWNGTAWGIRDDEHSSLATGPPPSTDGDGAGVAPVADGSPTTALVDDGTVVATAAAITVEPSSEAPPAAASSSEPEHTPARAAPARFCETCGAARSPTGRFCTACGSA